MSEKAIRVSTVSVEKLFGVYNHEINFNQNEKITVLHGPNGVGKTVIFKLLVDLLTGIGTDLLKYPFHKFEILLSNGLIVSAKKQQTNEVELTANRHKIVIDKKAFKLLADTIEDRTHIQRFGADTWFDPIRGIQLQAEDVVRDYFYVLEHKKGLSHPLEKFRSLVKILPNAYLIEAQRILKLKYSEPHTRSYRSENISFQETVTDYSNQLKEKIESALAEYGRQAQKLDQTFPQRLLATSDQDFSEDNIELHLKEIEIRQNKYKSLGLIDVDISTFKGLGEIRYNSIKLAAMNVYLNDMRSKLNVLNDLAEKIILLLDLVNEKLNSKNLLIDKDKGFLVKTINGDKLPLSVLSSGEQHEIIITYDLLFNVPRNSLVLIDEPELSLHVNWQERFLNDISKIIQLTGFDVALATHSPFIINGRNDLVVKLDGVGQRENKKKTLSSNMLKEIYELHRKNFL